MNISRQLSTTASETKDPYEAVKAVIGESESFKAFLQHLVKSYTFLLIFFMNQYKIHFLQYSDFRIQVNYFLSIQNTSLCVTFSLFFFIHSTENLLFLVEYSQIKCYYFTIMNRDSDTIKMDDNRSGRLYYHGHANEKSMEIELRFPADIPKSILLTTHDTFKKQLCGLYKKYIQNGSDHEVNVSAQTRAHLCDVFEQEDMNKVAENDIMNAMDNAACEIFMLLQDPFSRYRLSMDLEE